MDPDPAAILKIIQRLLEEAQGVLPPDECAGLGKLFANRKGANLADKGWFTIKEAMAWTGFGRDRLCAMMHQRKLWYQKFPGRGGRMEIRIPHAHLDDQMAKGFPVLDLPLSITEKEITHNRPVTRLIPGPKLEDDDQLPPKFY